MTWLIFLEGRDGGVKAVHSYRTNDSRRTACVTGGSRGTQCPPRPPDEHFLCFCKAIALSKVKGTPKFRVTAELMNHHSRHWKTFTCALPHAGETQTTATRLVAVSACPTWHRGTLVAAHHCSYIPKGSSRVTQRNKYAKSSAAWPSPCRLIWSL